MARVSCIARPPLPMWGSRASPPVEVVFVEFGFSNTRELLVCSKFLQGSAGSFDNTFAVLVCSGTAFSSGCPCC
jgi:hypothetical protein